MKRRNGFQPRVLISLLMFFLQVVLVVTFFVVLVLSPFGTEFYLGGLIVLLLFDCVIGLFIANTKVEASFKISWLVVVICLPFVGGFLYLLFANKITTKKMRKNRFAVINDLYRPVTTLLAELRFGQSQHSNASRDLWRCSVQI